jgi:hypothetical protein
MPRDERVSFMRSTGRNILQRRGGEEERRRGEET